MLKNIQFLKNKNVNKNTAELCLKLCNFLKI